MNKPEYDCEGHERLKGMGCPKCETAAQATKFKSNVRLHECSDGDTGRSQLLFYCSPEIQKEFAGKRVDIQIVLESANKKSKHVGGGK
jgi:hypothetical protein